MTPVFPVSPDLRKALIRILAFCLLFLAARPASACTGPDCKPVSDAISKSVDRATNTISPLVRKEPAPIVKKVHALPEPKPTDQKGRAQHHSLLPIILPTIGVLSLFCLLLSGLLRLPAGLLSACNLVFDLFSSASLILLITHRLNGAPGKVHLLLSFKSILLAGLLLLHAFLEHRKSTGAFATAPINRIREKLKEAGLTLLSKTRGKFRRASAA